MISLIIVIVCLIVFLLICVIDCLFVLLQTRSSPGRNQLSIWTTVLNLLDKWSSRWWWWWWWRWWWWWGWWWWWCSKPKFLLSWTNDGAGSMMLFLWWLEQKNNLYLKYSEHGVECGVLPFLSCWWRWKRLTFMNFRNSSGIGKRLYILKGLWGIKIWQVFAGADWERGDAKQSSETGSSGSLWGK